MHSVCEPLNSALERQAKLGASCRVQVPVGKGLTHHPYRVLRPWRSRRCFVEAKHRPKVNKKGEAYTENCAGRRAFVAPESWYSFEMPIEIDEGFNVHRSQHRSIRNGKDVKDLRRQQAVACTKRCIQELGSPIEAQTGNGKRRLNC